MKTIKHMIIRHMRTITLVMVVILIAIVVLAQSLNVQYQARERADVMFQQIEQLLNENQTELEQVKEEYSQKCLNNAEAIAYIIESRPDVLEDIAELQKIADFMEVDEIHIFNEEGSIFTGTHPEYYGLNVNDGKQIEFFKPMLTDKSLKLCQEITPNTAEKKPMQYSAVWSSNGSMIVQVGMEPDSVMEVTEKNELSYIFSLLKVNVGVHIYAIDPESGQILGATTSQHVGRKLSEVGFSMTKIQEKPHGFHATIDGAFSYCVFTEMEDTLIGRVISVDILYQNIIATSIVLTLCLVCIGLILVFSVTRYMNKHVVKGIYQVNEKLRAISDGNLEEKVEVRNSLEFVELSEHINDMVKSLLDNIEKISYVLNRTNMRIGVYEYNTNMKYVRFTEYMADLLAAYNGEAGQYFCDRETFAKRMQMLQRNKVLGENNIYVIHGHTDIYLKMEEIRQNNRVMGVVMDVTKDIVKRREIEADRDIDSLTGLYNRRGMNHKLEQLWENPKSLGVSAIIMVDADGLKEVNDQYGHENGDSYLKKLADVLNSFGTRSCVSARYGGDEFVLFLYHYDSKQELLESIKTLQYIQENST